MSEPDLEICPISFSKLEALQHCHQYQKFDCDPLTSKMLSKPERNELNSKPITNDERHDFLKRMERFRQNQWRRPSICPQLQSFTPSKSKFTNKTKKQAKPKQLIQKLETLQTEAINPTDSRRKSDNVARIISPHDFLNGKHQQRRYTDFSRRSTNSRQSVLIPHSMPFSQKSKKQDSEVPATPPSPTRRSLAFGCRKPSNTSMDFVAAFRKSHDFKVFDYYTQNADIINPNAIRLRNLKNYPKCLIFPDDPWKKKWDMLLLLACVVTSLITPFHVAFYDQSSLPWILAQAAIDLIFFVDIIFSFITVYYTDTEDVVDKRKVIACTYLKCWFLIDVISILPIHYILQSQFNSNSLGQLARIPRIYRITKTLKQVRDKARVMRMMKFVKKGTLIKQSMSKFFKSSMALEKMTKLALGFILLLHTMSCFWFLAAKLDDFPQDCWVIRYALDQNAPLDQYLDSLYFILTTITTVGYGDRTAETNVEIIFCCILMIIGVIAYTMVISQLTIIISESDRKQALLKEKLNILQSIRKEYGMNFDLYLRLRQSIHHRVLKDKEDHNALMEELPTKLRIELSNLLYRHQVKDIAYFKRQSPQFVASVAPILKSMKFQKGEYVFLKGDPIDGIYFVKKGETAYVVRQEEADVVFAINKEGSCFGEIDFAISALNHEVVRQYPVKALSDVELLVLEKQDLYKIDMEFKNQIYWLFDQSKENLRELRKYANKAKIWIKENGENFISDSDPTVTYSSRNSDFTEEQEAIEEEKSFTESQFSREEEGSEPETIRSQREMQSHDLLSVPASRAKIERQRQKKQQRYLKKRETIGSQILKRSFSSRNNFDDFTERIRQVLSEDEEGESDRSSSCSKRKKGHQRPSRFSKEQHKRISIREAWQAGGVEERHRQRNMESFGRSSPLSNSFERNTSMLSVESPHQSFRIQVHRPNNELISPPRSPSGQSVQNKKVNEINESGASLINVSLSGNQDSLLTGYSFYSQREEERRVRK